MDPVTFLARCGRRGWRLGLVAALTGWGLSGCTVIRIEGAQAQTSLYPGLLVLRLDPQADRVAVVRTRQFGLGLGWRSATLGWVQEEAFVAGADPGCRLVLVLPAEAAASAASAWGLDRPNGRTPCMVTTEMGD